MEKSRKELELNRRLSFRPKPEDIAHDIETPNDLRKADIYYLNIYSYRDKTTLDENNLNNMSDDNENNNDNSDNNHIDNNDNNNNGNNNSNNNYNNSDHNDNNNNNNNKNNDNKTNNIDKNNSNNNDRPILLNSNSDPSLKQTKEKIKSKQKHPLEWKFGQRSKLEDIKARGIVTDEYLTVIRGNKDVDKANEEAKKNRQSKLKILNKKFANKLRPSKDDLEIRGVVPRGAFEDPDIASQMLEEYKKKIKFLWVQNLNKE